MRSVLAALAFGAALLAAAQPSQLATPDAATETRVKALAEELRCLVCQNQTIADSSAPLAADLRNQIREQIAQGRSDAQIRDYMVERYGDFVLYRPPLKATTALLWGGPFALLAIGIMVLVRITRRSSADRPVPGDEARRAEVAALLAGESGREKG